MLEVETKGANGRRELTRGRINSVEGRCSTVILCRSFRRQVIKVSTVGREDPYDHWISKRAYRLETSPRRQHLCRQDLRPCNLAFLGRTRLVEGCHFSATSTVCQFPILLSKWFPTDGSESHHLRCERETNYSHPGASHHGHSCSSHKHNIHCKPVNSMADCTVERCSEKHRGETCGRGFPAFQTFGLSRVSCWLVCGMLSSWRIIFSTHSQAWTSIWVGQHKPHFIRHISP